MTLLSVLYTAAASGAGNRAYNGPRISRQIGRRRAATFGIASALVAAVVGCKDLTGTTQLQAGVSNPSFYNTPTGSQEMYATVIYTFETTLSRVIIESGLITDELEDRSVGTSQGVLQQSSTVTDPLDERILPEGASSDAQQVYGDLQAVRAYIGQSRGALLTYDTAATDTAKVRVLRGQLALLEGYTDTWLAEFFCSGVPLSTVDFNKDFTYAAGSTTTQVYRTALAQFDTALSLTTDSATLQNAAHIAKGRVYLELGLYDSAAVAVQGIPTAFKYQLAVRAQGGAFDWNFINDFATMSDREGGNGLPYLSSGDPRTTGTVVGSHYQTGTLLIFPNKYVAPGNFAPFVLASGIEARLIEAEVDLHTNPAGTQWLTALNDLRASGPTQTAPAGTGGISGLGWLSDPGASLSGTAAATARARLVFDERGYWLFLTGHRQGDLRRLIRQWGLQQSQVYPTGPYTAPGIGTYGSDVTMSIPKAESLNPNFQGCLDRKA